MIFIFCLKFVGIEGVVTGVVDLFPQHLRRGHRKEMFTAFICCIWFLLGLSMVTEVKVRSMFCMYNDRTLFQNIFCLNIFIPDTGTSEKLISFLCRLVIGALVYQPVYHFHSSRHTNRQADKQTGRQTGRQAERQTDRQTDSQTEEKETI